MSSFSAAHTAIAQATLSVANRRLDTLKLNERTPRRHPKQQIRKLARSIQAFGFNVPVLIDGKSQVIAGHARVLACRELGWSEVPTICLDHLSEAQVQAYMLADNRLSE